jgi:hypothetical protein
VFWPTFLRCALYFLMREYIGQALEICAPSAAIWVHIGQGWLLCKIMGSPKESKHKLRELLSIEVEKMPQMRDLDQGQ